MKELYKSEFENTYLNQHQEYVETGLNKFKKDDWKYISPGGGIAVFSGIDSPMTQCVCVDFQKITPEEVIYEIESFYFNSKSDVNIEIHSDSDVKNIFLEKGYRVTEKTNIYIKELKNLKFSQKNKNVFLASNENILDLTKVLTRGFLNGKEDPELEFLTEIYLNCKNFKNFYSVIDSQKVGSGFLYLGNTAGMFCGTSTLPEYRNQGVQTSLIKERIRYAVENKLSFVAVVVEDGSLSEKNFLKQDFIKLFSKIKLTKNFKDV